MKQDVASGRKLLALDGIRGLAIFSVFLDHGGYRVSRPDSIHDWVSSLCLEGWIGVDLFFVLSGFLITGILLDSRRADNYFRSFYARRALRIFPLYYVFVIVAFAVFPFIVTSDWMPASGDRWLYFCYLTNWMALWKGSWGANIVGHLWSLAVEEQFYFCWPLLVFVLRPRALLPVLLGAEAVVVGGRAWWVMAHGTAKAIELATVTRMDGLLLGAVVAVIVRRYRIPERVEQVLPWGAFAGVVTYLVLAFMSADSERVTQLYAYPLLGASFAMLVMYAAVCDDSRAIVIHAMKWRPLTQAGKHAYGIYLYHVPMLYFANRLIDKLLPHMDDGPVWVPYLLVTAEWFLCYYVAKISYNYFERYFLNFKDRFAAHIPQKEISLTV